MTKDHSKYLEKNEGYVEVTPEVEDLTKKIIGKSRTDSSKARKIYNYVRDKPFGFTPAAPAHKLINEEYLDCGSKHVLQTSMHRSIGIPSRIAMFECPFAVYYRSAANIPIPDFAKNIMQTLMFSVEDQILGANHYATEAYYDGKWNLLDATMHPELCNYFEGDKKEMCLSDANVSGVVGCRKIGHTTDLPSTQVMFEYAGKIVTDILGKKNVLGDVLTKNRLSSALPFIESLIGDKESIL